MGRIIKEQVLLYRAMLIIMLIKEQVQDQEDLDPHKGQLSEEQEVLSLLD